jgi:hypothetical protein
MQDGDGERCWDLLVVRNNCCSYTLRSERMMILGVLSKRSSTVLRIERRVGCSFTHTDLLCLSVDLVGKSVCVNSLFLFSIVAIARQCDFTPKTVIVRKVYGGFPESGQSQFDYWRMRLDILRFYNGFMSLLFVL